MNNMNFDPITGEPIQNIQNMQNTTPLDNQSIITKENNEVINEPSIDSNVQSINTSSTEAVQIQNELQNIPTVEQDKEAFINNVQTLNQEKHEEKKEGVNFVFILILFIVILTAIYFLFPLLLKYM